MERCDLFVRYLPPSMLFAKINVEKHYSFQSDLIILDDLLIP